VDIRQRFSAYDAARRDTARARALLDAALMNTSLAVAEGPSEAGPELGYRRLQNATKRLSDAEAALSEGRSLLEVLWSLPDDL
jgi:hypothetical protein